jgi:hypothetical protein
MLVNLITRPPIGRAVDDEVIRPISDGILWPEPNARTVIEQQAPAFGLIGSYFKQASRAAGCAATAWHFSANL